MKHYKVFKRGDRYRIAAPTRFRWRWVYDYFPGITGGYRIRFETTDLNDAQMKARKLNEEEQQRFKYSQDHWRSL